MSTFLLDLQAFAKKAEAKADTAVKWVVAGLAENVIERSPVGDGAYWQRPPPKGYVGGRFRANWDYGFDVVPKNTYNVLDKSGAVSLARVMSAMNGKKMAGHIHFLANNLPYAQRIEDGWSRQAPVGVVRVAALTFNSILQGVPK